MVAAHCYDHGRHGAAAFLITTCGPCNINGRKKNRCFKSRRVADIVYLYDENGQPKYKQDYDHDGNPSRVYQMYTGFIRGAKNILTSSSEQEKDKDAEPWEQQEDKDGFTIYRNRTTKKVAVRKKLHW